MKIFVTGGHGFIGARVVRRLVGQGHAPTLLVRPHSDLRRVADLKLPTAQGDVRDLPSLLRAMPGHTSVVHLACSCAWATVDTEEVVLQGTTHVVRAASKSGVRRVVHVSSSAAIGARWQPEVLDESNRELGAAESLRYARAKHRAELLATELAHSLGVELVIVNPAETYGPDDGFVTSGNLRDILKGWPAVACHGGVCMTHVDDVAAGIVAALEKGRPLERYILGGENLRVEELVRWTLKVGRQSKPVMRVPNGVLRSAVRGMKAVGWAPPVEPVALEYATRFWFASSAKAQRELGYCWRPPGEVLSDAVHWLEQQGHV